MLRPFVLKPILFLTLLILFLAGCSNPWYINSDRQNDVSVNMAIPKDFEKSLKIKSDAEIIEIVKKSKSSIVIPSDFDISKINQELLESIIVYLIESEKSYKNNQLISKENNVLFSRILKLASSNTGLPSSEVNFLLTQLQLHNESLNTIQEARKNKNYVAEYEGKVLFFLTKEVILDAIDLERNLYELFIRKLTRCVN
ncbi:hypothetical protein [Thermotalea metallivorans]|uniref:Lipoprotein n=1 Tax=Thermotalea metallivorans TaxID=520762 RepID=A0A140LEG8_9FIRM|nr:hypothetical protein [Thermotalea metallivorans]KXG78943.1 hypothetical protein AN619_01030 [Thermotalea metallivorans]